MSDIVNNNLLHYFFATIYARGHCNMSYNDWVNIDNLIESIQTPNMLFCEIGTNSGHSACLLGIWAKQLKGKLITIDPMSYIPAEAVLNCLKINLKHFDIESNVEYIKEYSYDIVNKFPDEYFDFILIDGNHEYLEVKKDILLYYPKLKTNGIMCGHDCEFLVDKDGFINIKDIRYQPMIQPYIDGLKNLYGYKTEISLANEGIFNIKEIHEWDKRDILGLSYNKAGHFPVLGVHPGVIMAVSEIFGDKTTIWGDRIWWIKKV